MASEILTRKSLVVSLEEGLTEKGSPITKRYTFSNIKTDAASQSLLEAAQALGTLFKGEVSGYHTVNHNDLF